MLFLIEKENWVNLNRRVSPSKAIAGGGGGGRVLWVLKTPPPPDKERSIKRSTRMYEKVH